MSWLSDKERLQAEARKIDKSVKLVSKDGKFWKIIAWFLFIVSFGAFKRENFLTRFATTIGNIQAYPATWSVATVERVIVHESRHSRQARFCGFGIHPLVGLPIMMLIYVLFPFPVLFAFPRALLEMDADRASWRALLASGTPSSVIIARAQNFAETISSSEYMWSIPKSLAVKLFVWAANRTIAEKCQ